MPRPEPPAGGLNPLYRTWTAGRRISRTYQAVYGPTGFNPTGGSARFRPTFMGPADARTPVPSMYGAEDREISLAEGLLRGVDDHSRRRLYIKEVRGLAAVELIPLRDLRLVRLNGPGLLRLGLTRADVIDTDKRKYPYTARWAQALHDLPAEPDGLLWTSRQADSGDAIIVWGDRVRMTDLEEDAPPVRLDQEPGLDLVRRACLDAGFDFEG